VPLASLLCGAYLKKFQVLRRESPNRFDFPIASHSLHCAKTSLSGNYYVLPQRDAGWQIKRAFLLVMADGLITVKIKSVGDLPLYVEGSDRLVGRHPKFRQPLVDGSR